MTSKDSLPNLREVTTRDHGKGIHALYLQKAELTATLTNELVQLLAHSAKLAELKVLVIVANPAAPLSGNREALDAATHAGLWQALATLECPMLLVAQAGFTGAGCLIAAAADVLLLAESATCGWTDSTDGLFPDKLEESLLAARWGQQKAERFIYDMTFQTAASLRDQQGWNAMILPAGQLETRAFALAGIISDKSVLSLRLLKKHLAKPVSQWLSELQPSTLETHYRLASRAPKNLKSPGTQIRIETTENYLALVVTNAKENYTSTAMVNDLTSVFNELVERFSKQTLRFKALVLQSEYPGFFPDELTADDVRKFHDAMSASPIPVILSLTQNLNGFAWLAAMAAEAVIYAEEKYYSAAGLLDTELAALATEIFSDRLGYSGRQVLAAGQQVSGAELAHRAYARVASSPQTLAIAKELAHRWAQASFENLNAWKQQRSARVKSIISNLPNWTSMQPSTEKLPGLITSIPLDSNVIRAEAHPEGFVVIHMEDRTAKNMFSQDFNAGMERIFALINESSVYKSVVLVGFDSYFASGGTRDSLLAIQSGEAQFTDNRVYQLAFSCKVPVIAAIQGHGIGGGLTLGLFADFVILSEESKYLSPYMNYGFTPGAGATLVTPEKFGLELATETLLSAEEISGSELRARGLRLPVLPRESVEEAGRVLATALCSYSRGILEQFKVQSNRRLRECLEANYDAELAMHEQTFVKQENALEQIQSQFESGVNSASNANLKPQAQKESFIEKASARTAPKLNEAQVKTALIEFLAAELHMRASDIDEETQFVDLGLDSITGVTFIRKVNTHFGTDIEATKVYSYPNINLLTEYVYKETLTMGSAELTPAELPEIKPVAVKIELKTETYLQAEAKPVVTHQQQAEPRQAHKQPILSNTQIQASLKSLLAEELHMKLEDVDEDTQFVDLGLDSITGVTFVKRINQCFGTAIEATKVYAYPTVTQMAAYVSEEIGQAMPTLETTKEPVPAEPVVETKIIAKPRPKLQSLRKQLVTPVSSVAPIAVTNNSALEAIAIIGMSGQFPKANNIDEYWQNIADGVNCIEEVPTSRWDMNQYYVDQMGVPGKTNCRFMGALPNVDCFDPAFFEISPKEALSMDPQQRLFLQTSWHAFEHAGYSRRAVAGSKTGVFVGCGPSDYHLLAKELQISALGFTGCDTSILAARVAYLLNLQGPCLTIETACSSSLVAIASACDSLISGASDMALAGGVGVIVGPDLHIKTAQTAMLSPDGRCFTFDQRANGFVPGEAVGAVLLKRLADAERDGDRIYAVIKGWGVNQDGKTNGITAPNPEAQTRLEADVYRKFSIDPGSIQLIEAHGTGTKLGDPIEVDALKQAFKQFTRNTGYCALGSVKSNIGHCFTAAGIASLIKVVQSIQHQQLPPTINFEQLNEHIRLDNSPFYVNSQLRQWEPNNSGERVAAVSGFGFGGTNAHLVVAEYPRAIDEQVRPLVTNSDAQVVVLSAASEERLKAYANDLLIFVEKHSCDLANLAYTMQVARHPLEYRLALVVDSIAELGQKLNAFLSGKKQEGIFQADISSNKESLALFKQDADMRETLISRWMHQGQLPKLAELWSKGLEVDWDKLHGDNKPRRIAAPTYPFLKQRFWITDVAQPLTANQYIQASVIHPLLHRNCSNFQQQAYTTCLRGNENFLPGGVVTPMAFMEMARVAVLDATGLELNAEGLATQQALHFAKIQFSGNAVITEATEIEIALFPVSDSQIEFDIYSANNSWVYCKGSIGLVNAKAQALIDLAALKTQVTADSLNQLLVSISLPSLGNSDTDIELHPQLLDLTLVTARQQNSQLLAEFDAARVSILDSLDFNTRAGLQLVAWVRRSSSGNNLDIDWLDNDGKICCAIHGIHFGNQTSAISASTLIQTIPSTQTRKPFQSGSIQPESTPVQPKMAKTEVQKRVVSTLAKALYMEAADIKLDKPFIELGLDSIVGVEWISALNKELGINLNATCVYDYPNVQQFTTYLMTVLPTETVTPAVISNASQSLVASPVIPTSQATPGHTGHTGYTKSDLQKMLVNSLAKALYMESSDIKLDKPFIELGLDSIVGVEWVNSLNKELGITLNATRVYDYPNILAFTDYLLTCLPQAETAQEQTVSAPVAPQQPVTITNESTIQKFPGNQTTAYSKPELQKILVTSLAKALYMDAADIKLDKPFIELGLDSIVGVEWVNELNKTLGLTLNATRVYDYPNVQAFAEYLLSELPRVDIEAPVIRAAEMQIIKPVASTEISIAVPATQPQPRLQKRSPSAHTSHRFTGKRQIAEEKIAIIGMSGHYPDAPNLEQFWENLVAGKNSIREVPAWRWDNKDWFDANPEAPGKMYCKWMGMLDDIACFDPLFFRISPAEAKTMDPQHRLFLEECYKTIENAGYSGESLSNSKTGVYFGIIGREYADTLARSGVVNPDITGNNYAIGAGRVAYLLNLKGPAIAIDTACSSSLVAMHLGVQALQLGEIDLALAGGASVYLEPATYVGMCQAGMLSKDGQCKTFDNSANGFVPGEGAGAVLLKRLSDAERDGDYIHGVIIGSGMNQDGKTNGITAPSVNSQIELERSIYRKYGIHPETINYIETHGTGTKLGDPIELEALATVFREQTGRRNFCGLGSVKSNLGHTSGAAGVASVHKVLLSMKHQTLVPTLNISRENTLFNFADSPFYVQRQRQTWTTTESPMRRAGVSSFGFSGTNAHLVLEEYVNSATQENLPKPALIVLSARTQEQLEQKAKELNAYLQREKPGLASLAYTLFTGRDAMDYRCALVVNSVDELRGRLGHFSTLTQGKVERDADGLVLINQDATITQRVANLVSANKLDDVAHMWVKGLELSWSVLYNDLKPQRIPLPTYPFSRKKYWVDAVITASSKAVAMNQLPSMAASHPLLQTNISGLGHQSFSSSFRGDEIFLVSRTPGSQEKLLPASAQLEMARAAILQAAPTASGKTIQLEQLRFGRPLVVTADRQVNIVLLANDQHHLDFEIYSLSATTDGNTEEIIHCQGKAIVIEQFTESRFDVQSHRQGLTANPGRQELLVDISLPKDMQDQLANFGLHPVVADQGLAALAALTSGKSVAPEHLSLPVSIAEVRILNSFSAEMLVWARASSWNQGKFPQATFDLLICDAAGQVAAELSGVTYSLVSRNQALHKPVMSETTSAPKVQVQVQSQPQAKAVAKPLVQTNTLDKIPEKNPQAAVGKPAQINLLALGRNQANDQQANITTPNTAKPRIALTLATQTGVKSQSIQQKPSVALVTLATKIAPQKLSLDTSSQSLTQVSIQSSTHASAQKPTSLGKPSIALTKVEF